MDPENKYHITVAAKAFYVEDQSDPEKNHVVAFEHPMLQQSFANKKFLWLGGLSGCKKQKVVDLP